MSSIRALNDALIDYYDTHDIEGLLSDIQEINEKLALNHPYLANTILDYVEGGNAEMVVERIKYLVDGFDEGYEYTTGEDIRYSLATDVATILEEYDNVQEIAQAVDNLNKTFPNGSGLLENALEFYKQGNEDEFINVLKATAKLPQKRVKVNNADAKDVTENIFGGIWIADSQEFAKFAKAVNNSPFEEDGEGIAYTDNYFYAYYRNINGEPVPYASVYMNEAVSQDIVKKVIKELNDVRTSGRVKERIDSSLEWIRNVQSQNNVNNGDNSGASSRRGDEQLGVVLLRKGRYFDNASLYVKTSRTDGRGDVDYRYSLRETDPEILEQLNKGNTIKVYRAMQVIDGELYPPMSARVGGKLRAPIVLGEWERAEERPDLADDKGYFKLDKGNSTSLKARYNPYIHTSLTPLNDQFSSAQDRPNLVTVEVEIPESELTSGYKADKAKDAVGKLEWKAGVVQSQLTGTRTVILSRWDRPIRIVPDSEVAQRIVEMFGDTKVIMPTNVVTPTLRKELEKLGVVFRETDNQGKPKPQTLTTANGEVIADVNKAQGQALFSLRTYRDEGREVLAEFLGRQV